MMRRLGYNGKCMSQAYEKFFDCMEKSSAKLFMFEHTFDEPYGIIFTFKLNIAQNNFGAHGVDKFLKARNEIDGGLPLEEDTIRQRIIECHVGIFASYNEEDSEEAYRLEWDLGVSIKVRNFSVRF